ncbi:MAG TPA: DUF5701 family protein [Chloroflexia bacterium]|nr:DUF5701 family protein [Chloroflexia bacterium]
MDLHQEFDRQFNNLLRKGYAEVANKSREEFSRYIRPLKDKLQDLTVPEIDLERGHLPLVIVIKSDLVSTERAMSLAEKEGKEGTTKLYPHAPGDFQTIGNVTVPDGMAYLLVDVDRGKENINLPPNEAIVLIEKAERSPLTIDEGVAILTQFPEFLVKNNCYSLLASRYKGDQRVPAIWINANKNPNLGWCWDGNPHTWLGSASCKIRIG